jgi:hypothetical protein
MKYKYQCECMDDDCNTVIVGTDNRLDGIRCPRCEGPVTTKPFESRKAWVRYKCLCCEHSERVTSTKEKYQEVCVCPKCNGALVDVWKIKRYKQKKMDFKVNFNEYVKVKLTEEGIKILKEQHEELNRTIREHNGTGLGEFNLKQDEFGYTSFQLWSLMNHFGYYMTLGGEPPFESEIVITNGESLDYAK